jgi:hypothetical protein
MKVFVSAVTWAVCSLQSVTMQKDNSNEQFLMFFSWWLLSDDFQGCNNKTTSDCGPLAHVILYTWPLMIPK